MNKTKENTGVDVKPDNSGHRERLKKRYHPSGDVTPSHADLDITNKINVASHAVGIKLFDHLIVSKNGYYSFKDHGLIAELKN